jgi:diguanylate cyclase (GGDEF)-like protein
MGFWTNLSADSGKYAPCWHSELSWLSLCVTFQWGYLAGGVSLNLIILPWSTIFYVALGQAFLQCIFLRLYNIKHLKNLGLDLVFLVHLTLTGLAMLGVAHLGQPYAFELMLFYLPLVVVGYNVTRMTSKLVISVFGSIGFLALIVLYHAPNLHDTNLLAQIVMPLWRWISYLTLIFFAFLVACLCAHLHRTADSKSKQLFESLRLIRRLTVKDELTGLFNQRYMIEQIEKQKDIADRGEYCFVVAAIEIDDFDGLIEAHSEGAANEVMQNVASVVSGHIRNVDFCARWDDAMFIVLLINTFADRTKAVFERINQSVEDRSFYSIGIDRPVTVSIGITQYVCTESWETLVQRAEGALVTAQEKGRGSIESVLPTIRRVELVRDPENRLSPL